MLEGSGRILLIENCDFRSYPPGGQLTFARHLIRAFGDRLALVGASTNGEPIGQWIEQEFEGRRMPFLAVGRVRPRAEKPWLPARLRFWLALGRHRRRILACGARHAIALAPETMMALSGWGLEVCYHFSGVDNPLRLSRYRWARPLAGWFERRHFRSARRAALLLAHAEPNELDRLAQRSGGRLDRQRLHWFPTCVDTELFRPRSKEAARRALGLAEDATLLVVAGRIARVKGWDLALEAFAHYRNSDPSGQMWFVGDGEDRRELEAAAIRMGLDGAVRVAGFQSREALALWWNAADVAVFPSRREGWSNALLEALASGCAVVATPVGGARELVREGVNGYLAPADDVRTFAAAIEAARRLPAAKTVSREMAERYSVGRMAARHRQLWPVLAEARPAAEEAPGGWLLGVRVQAVGMRAAIERILDWARRGESRNVCLATVYSLMLARDCFSYRAALNRADLVTADGMPLVWALRRLGFPRAERVAGPDLTPLLLEAAEKAELPVGFYGARPEVLGALLETVRKRFPRLRIAYAWSPPFRPLTAEEDRRVVEEIRRSGAKILFVGLGTPKQDFWTDAHRGCIPAVMLGVGQVFDLMAGAQRRAPRWMRDCGLEWLYRLLREPGRLWRRYLPHNPRFLWWLLGLGTGARRRPATGG